MSTQNFDGRPENKTARFVLYATPRSPFARRVRLALERLDLSYELRLIDLFHPTPEFLAANPLALVPALQDVRTGMTYPDSSAILEILQEFEATHDGIWPAEASRRREIRRISTWITGILTAVVARYLEKLRPEDAENRSWVQEYEQNVLRTLDVLRQNPWGEPEELAAFTQADWDLTVMLEYLDLRWPELDWRSRYPEWEKWLERAQKAEFFRVSKPPV